MADLSTSRKVKKPQPLRHGDTIAICSPAGPISKDKVNGAADVLRNYGWKVRIMPHTLGQYGNYSGKDSERYDDLATALTDPEVRAVICSRGGYGVVHLLDSLDKLDLATDPKWVVGFSDISALHALMVRHGIASIHGSMTDAIRRGANDKDNARLFDLLQGRRDPIAFATDPRHDRPGIASGTLYGGNLAVLADLLDTRFDLLRRDSILFIEDVSEPIYKIERIMYQLRISGILPSLRGLMVGQFTEYHPDASYQDMNDMIADMVAPYSFPVAFNVPIGHVQHNVPVIEGAQVTLKVTTGDTSNLIYWS